MLLAPLLERAIKVGTLTVIDSHGATRRFGAGGDDGSGEAQEATIRLADRAVELALLLKPRLSFGEAYMDGRLTVEGCSIYDVLSLLARGTDLGRVGLFRLPVGRFLRRLQQHNPLSRARANVAHHYNLSAALYALFLDADRQYSCAYFPTPGTSLDDAQAAKKRHIAAKLLLRPGHKVLDIGCGWGGLALFLASAADVEVTGITLSAEQHAVAVERAARAGLADRVRFEIRDYREVSGTYDRIVSVGMFEHVGAPHYPTYFQQIRRLLAEDGVALLHSIGRMDGPGETNPWIRKYIFPGGYSPALSEVLPAVERAGLWATDIEILRLHYAETLRAWRQRFLAHRAEIAQLYDERFCRMWEFYLAGSEVTFRYQGHMVFQMQLARGVTTVPLTRDYVHDWEHGQASAAEMAA